MSEFLTETINGEACTNWQEIQRAAAKYRRARIKVDEYSEELMESEKQRKWLNGVAIPFLMDKWGRSRMWVKTQLKLCCGADFFTAKEVKIEGHTFWIISSENDLTLKRCRTWIENILDYAPCDKAGLEPPDPSWKSKKQPTPLFEETKQ
ncbi:hypothetical protein LCGC14_0400700 [marine sediment metagenome]|uniref:Uncharacterized protein n=1 Tax=marine sediment metagenome TaxID=412755 RepID=A0A0F9T2N6_9ZZZZ